ncbi:hypothetical protein BSKO_03760 [Bryopsis sp. KO-2023]|nr:hypothetical protein BSKO_03760 [Bryopsis sp. KO-2023]
MLPARVFLRRTIQDVGSRASCLCGISTSCGTATLLGSDGGSNSMAVDSSQNSANMWHFLGSPNSTCRQFSAMVDMRMEERDKERGTQEVSKMSGEDLDSLVSSFADRIDASKPTQHDVSKFLAACKQTLEESKRLNGSNLAHMLHEIANVAKLSDEAKEWVRHEDDTLWEILNSKVIALTHRFEPPDTIRLLKSYIEIGGRVIKGPDKSTLAQGLCEVALKHPKGFDAGEMSVALKSLATIAPWEDKVVVKRVTQIAESVALKMDQFKIEELIDVGWAVSKFYIPNRRQMATLIANRSRKSDLENVKPANMCKLLSVLGALGLDDQHGIIKDVLLILEEKISDVQEGADLVALFSGLAKLQVDGVEEMIESVLAELEIRLEDLEPKQIGHLAKCLAKVRMEPQDKMDTLGVISVELDSRCEAFQPIVLIEVLESFLKSKFYPGERTLQSVVEFADNRADELSGGNIAKLVNALAEFNALEGSLKFFDKVKTRVLEGNMYLTPSEASLLAWAFAMSNRLDADLFGWVARCVEEQPETKHTQEMKVRMARCFVTLRGYGVRDVMFTPFIRSCYKTWREIELEQTPPSTIMEAFYFLEDMRYTCRPRHLIAGSLFIADTAISKQRNIAVEETSVSPRFANREKLFGQVLWRRRLLEFVGYSVMCIDEEKWGSLDDSGKQQYLYNMMMSGDMYSDTSW